MTIRIWQVKDHKKSEQAYVLINELAGTRQRFHEFMLDNKLCIAWKDANIALFSQIDQAMKKIAIRDLSEDSNAIDALNEDEKRWGITFEALKAMLKKTQ